MGKMKVRVSLYEKYDIPKRAKKELVRKKLNGKRRQGKVTYSKHDFMLYHGFDILENLHFVRHFMCRKHGIKFELLELLLYFYPKQCFTRRDYTEYPKMFNLNKIKYLVDDGYFSLVTKGAKSGTGIALYKLSRLSITIVQDFYKYLSGEKQIPESSVCNPFAKNTANAIDKKRLALIIKMKSIPPSEDKRRLFE
jgi:hypothetical protein